MRLVLTFFIVLFTTQINAQVEITGIAKNYSDTIFYIQEPGGFDNFTRAWRDKMIKIVINRYGHFKTTIPEQNINTWYLKTDKGNQFFDLIKGKGITLIADFSQSMPLNATGENADDFNFASSSYAQDSLDKYYKDNQILSKVRDKNIDSALFYRKATANYQIELLKQYRQSHHLSECYYNWLYSKYRYQPYERAIEENIENKDSVNENILQKIIEKGINDEYSALNNSDYNDIVDFYVLYKFNREQLGTFSVSKYFNFVANGNILTGSTKDVFLTRYMYRMRMTPDSIYNPLFEQYAKIVFNKKMKQSIVEARNDYDKPIITEKPNFVYSEESIGKIFQKYKGKVIYVDFWASWCIPCRQEMSNATILKDKLKGKNVVFIYFGYNDREKAWMKARKQLNVEGEHYLLTEKMVKEANEVFDINTIPHYAIIDKEGNIVNKRANRPSDAYQQLLTQTEK